MGWFRSRLAATCVAVLAAAVGVHAAGGDIDPTFGTNGFASHTIPNEGAAERRWVTVRDHVGRILMSRVLSASSIEIRRYLADGSADSAFGASGVRLVPVFPAHVHEMISSSVYGVFVLGSAMVRVDHDGDLDPGFGTGGVALFTGGFDFALQSDGRIVVTRYGCTTSPTTSCTVLLRRYLPNGILDGTFGTAGETTPIVLPVPVIQPPQVAIQSDDRILVTVGSDLIRYDVNGTRDLTFGVASGASPLPLANAHDLTLHGDAPIVVTSDDADLHALARFTAAGSVDGAFGLGGVSTVTVDGSIGDPVRLLVAPDGVLTVVTRDGYDHAWYRGSLVSRYGADGTLDEAFTPCGHAIPSAILVDDAALLDDGRVQLLGSFPPNQSAVTSNHQLRLAQLGTPDVDGPCQPPYPDSGRVQVGGMTGNKTIFRWRSSQTIFGGGYGDPTTGAGYAFCSIDATGASAGLYVAQSFPGAGLCNTKPCWRASGLSQRFKSTGGAVRKLVLKAGVAGKAKFVLKSNDAFAQSAVPVTLRIDRADGAQCWEATFTDIP